MPCRQRKEGQRFRGVSPGRKIEAPHACLVVTMPWGYPVCARKKYQKIMPRGGAISFTRPWPTIVYPHGHPAEIIASHRHREMFLTSSQSSACMSPGWDGSGKVEHSTLQIPHYAKKLGWTPPVEVQGTRRLVSRRPFEAVGFGP